MTVYVIRDKHTSNVLCEDVKDDGIMSQLLAFRIKEDAEVYYKEVIKDKDKYYVDRMEIISNKTMRKLKR